MAVGASTTSPTILQTIPGEDYMDKITVVGVAGGSASGKTSIAHSVAEAMGRKYVRVSLGGVPYQVNL